MANNNDDKKIIFSMVGVSKIIPPSRQILKDIYLSFYYGAKIGIIGLNGAGKSTLLRIIAGKEKSYNGEVVFSPGYSVGMLDQEPQLDENKTVRQVVEEGAQEVVDMLKEYEEISNKFAEPDADFDKLIERQGELTELIEQHDGWNLDSKLERAMDALNCPDGDTPVNNLSGGERRRVALVRLLLQEPDILLLDEPTNHLDLDMREALSIALSSYQGALILVSHDRHLLEAIADKLWLIDNGNVTEFNGDLNDYQEFLNQKNREYKEKLAQKKDNSLTLSASASSFKTKEQKKLEAQKRQALRPLKKEIEQLEKTMEKLRSEIAKIDETLSDSSLYQTQKEKVEELSIQRSEYSDKLDETELCWLTKQEELENAEAEI